MFGDLFCPCMKECVCVFDGQLSCMLLISLNMDVLPSHGTVCVCVCVCVLEGGMCGVCVCVCV